MAEGIGASYFRGQKLELALALSGERRTLYEAAKAIGKQSGSIQRAVRQMHAEGVLMASDDEPTQGTLFWLDPDHEETVVEALGERPVPGLLSSGERLLEVIHSDELALHRVLRRREFSDRIAWAAELDGASRWLIGLMPDVTRLQADRLKAALTLSGAECATRRVGDLYTREEFRLAGIAIHEAIEVHA